MNAERANVKRAHQMIDVGVCLGCWTTDIVNERHFVSHNEMPFILGDWRRNSERTSLLRVC